MAEVIPERGALIRSTVITGSLTTLFIVLSLLFWVWSAPDLVNTSPVGAIKQVNVYVLYVLEVLFVSGTFIFLTVTVVNLELGLMQIRAGWTEITILVITVFLLGLVLFGTGIAAASLVLSLGFVAYLYLLQE
ncbi:MAG: hypothetical protein QXS20_04050 [Candidatus Thorarchaeota archaeon]